MGTKIEYSINLLASSVDSNNFIVGGVDVWEHYQHKGVTNNHFSLGINKLQDPPMDRMLDRNNIESIKKTMQMHEDIFKQQVRELHRVYSVQKMLMDDQRKETKQKKFWTPTNGIDMSHSHFLQQQQQQQTATTLISYGPDFHVQSLKEVTCSKERSGSCSGETMKRQRGFDLQRCAERDIFGRCEENEAGPSSYTALERCKISSNGCDEDMEVDLTLSIGGSQVKNNNNNNNSIKKPYHLLPLGCSDSPNGKTRELNSSVSFQSDRVGDCSDPTTPMSSSSVTFDQERKGPHWLSQGLKLK